VVIPALSALAELTREIERLFPPDGPQFCVLARPLDELRRRIEAAGGRPIDVGPELDLLDDLLESLLRTRGWPAAGP
jgi:hypothetical protein